MNRTAEPAKTVRVADPELQALNKIGAVLNGLAEDTLQRVLAWINSRYAKLTWPPSWLKQPPAELPDGPVPHGMD